MVSICVVAKVRSASNRFWKKRVNARIGTSSDVDEIGQGGGTR